MTKTPEQMAEEYADHWHKDCNYPDEILRHTKKATATVFLAGYQAAKEQFSNADKVKPRQDGDLLHKVANDCLDMKAARYRRVCGYKK